MTEIVALQDSFVRDTLRAQTRTRHHRLHEHASFVALFDGSLGFEDYRNLMQRLYGFYSPLDSAILAVLSNHDISYDYASRSDFLARDLLDFGVSRDPMRKVPVCRRARDIVTPATLGGVLYVIEGATLGGATIDRAAQKMLPNEGKVGRSFWAWCRAKNKSRWKLVNQFLLQLSADGVAMDDLVEGANSTFDLFADWLAPLDATRDVVGRTSM